MLVAQLKSFPTTEYVSDAVKECRSHVYQATAEYCGHDQCASPVKINRLNGFRISELWAFACGNEEDFHYDDIQKMILICCPENLREF
uniref:DB domain-containing protein n=1 Tax=Caenorhabditis tropicalis TaxID=1561998 RepID=A0A1I7V3S7_9PELO